MPFYCRDAHELTKKSDKRMLALSCVQLGHMCVHNKLFRTWDWNCNQAQSRNKTNQRIVSAQVSSHIGRQFRNTNTDILTNIQQPLAFQCHLPWVSQASRIFWWPSPGHQVTTTIKEAASQDVNITLRQVTEAGMKLPVGIPEQIIINHGKNL